MIDIKRASDTVISIQPQEDSVHVRRIMAENEVNITFKSVDPVFLQIGDYIVFEGANYTLESIPTGRQINSREYEYRCSFKGIEYQLSRVVFKFFDNTPTPKQTDFDLTGDPLVFLNLIKANLDSATGQTWTIGEVIVGPFKTLSFNNENCFNALGRLAQEYDTEYFITNNREINFTTYTPQIEPPVLEYGMGKGLKEVIRADKENTLVTRLYAFGSERNVKVGYRDGARRLVLPGLPYRAQNEELYGRIEAAIIFEDIYPRLNAGLGANEPGRVTTAVDLLTFQDVNLDFDLNDHMLPGIKPKIVFNTGQLAGQEFEIESYNHSTKQFKILENNYENAGELPVPGIEFAIGDFYVLIDLDMPQQYVDRAELELQEKTIVYLSEYSHPRDVITVQTDPIQLKRVDQVFELGQLVNVIANPFNIDRNIRLVGFTRNVRNKYDYRLELADTITPGRIDIIEDAVDSNEKKIRVTSERDRTYTRRSFRNVRETVEMIFDPDGEYFNETIRPLVVETAQLVVGTQSQQFDFIGLRFRPNYQGNPNLFAWTTGALYHMNMDRSWTIDAGQLPTMTSATPYYIFAKVEKEGNTGTIVRSPSPITFDEEEDYYHLWVGVLSSVQDNHRSWQPMHGFTEITGQYITTGVIKSADGNTYFDLNNGEIGGRIVFNNGQKTLQELGDEFSQVDEYLYQALPIILEGFQDQLDGKIRQFFENYDPTPLNEPAVSWETEEERDAALGDLFYNVDTGKVWRWVKIDNVYQWKPLADSDLEAALSMAGDALNLAGTKRRIFVNTPYTPYEVGDLWVQGESGDILRCIFERLVGAYNAADWSKASKYTDDTTALEAKAMAESNLGQFNALMGALGGMAWEEMVEISKLGSTIIEGGYIKSSLIEIDALRVTGGFASNMDIMARLNNARPFLGNQYINRINRHSGNNEYPRLIATYQPLVYRDFAKVNFNQSFDGDAIRLTKSGVAGDVAEYSIGSNIATQDNGFRAGTTSFISFDLFVPSEFNHIRYRTNIKWAGDDGWQSTGAEIIPQFGVWHRVNANISVSQQFSEPGYFTRFLFRFQNMVNGEYVLVRRFMLTDGTPAAYGDPFDFDIDIPGLGQLAYLDMVSAAMLDDTIIVGGYIKSSLIEVNALRIAGGFLSNQNLFSSLNKVNPLMASVALNMISDHSANGVYPRVIKENFTIGFFYDGLSRSLEEDYMLLQTTSINPFMYIGHADPSLDTGYQYNRTYTLSFEIFVPLENSTTNIEVNYWKNNSMLYTSYSSIPMQKGEWVRMYFPIITTGTPVPGVHIRIAVRFPGTTTFQTFKIKNFLLHEGGGQLPYAESFEIEATIPDLGQLAYEDAVTLAMLDDTIIIGGYIKTSLIDVELLVARHVRTNPLNGQRVVIDGDANKMEFFNSANQKLMELNSVVGLDADSNEVSGLAIHNPNGRVSYIAGSGVFSNASGFPFISAVTGIQTNASLVGLLFNRNTDSQGISAGVVGLDATSSGNSDSYGGYFNSLFVGGMHFNFKYITANYTALETDTIIIAEHTSGTITVTLPAVKKVGKIYIISRDQVGPTLGINGNNSQIRVAGNMYNTIFVADAGNIHLLIWTGKHWHNAFMPRA